MAPGRRTAESLGLPMARGDGSETHSAEHKLRAAEQALARRRCDLGEDHPDTLSAANNLVIDLASVGEHERACQLAEETLARRRQILGEDRTPGPSRPPTTSPVC